MPLQYLFIYGTLLLPGNINAQYLIENFTYLKPGKIRGRLYDTGDYPGLIADVGAGYVHGSIYIIKKTKALQETDCYEGYGPDETQPNEYVRELKPVDTADESLNCFIYLYNLSVAGYKQITAGDYPDYLQTKNPPVIKPED